MKASAVLLVLTIVAVNGLVLNVNAQVPISSEQTEQSIKEQAYRNEFIDSIQGYDDEVDFVDDEILIRLKDSTKLTPSSKI